MMIINTEQLFKKPHLRYFPPVIPQGAKYSFNLYTDSGVNKKKNTLICWGLQTRQIDILKYVLLFPFHKEIRIDNTGQIRALILSNYNSVRLTKKSIL